jgi:hypothetical protein
MTSSGPIAISPSKLVRLSLLSFIPTASWCGYFVYVMYNRPHAVDRAAGLVYPMTTRGGSTIFLSLVDIVLLVILFLLAVLGIGAVQFQFWRARKQAGSK